MSIEIKRFVTGPIETNTYIVINERSHCLVVDPSSNCGEVLKSIVDASLTVDAVVLTHGHFDHALGLPEILEAIPNTPVWVHPADRDLLVDPRRNGSFLIGEEFSFCGAIRDLAQGALRIGDFDCTVVHVPGHTPGGCALVFDGHCISGDSLFADSVGRSDFEYGDGDLLLQGIKEKLLPLPDSTIVYPGHGGRTTIGRERRLNPFLQDA
ncbi:MAG TPA: MBL fold metallo-hydrolase [Chitinivibrionales bacterium]